MNKPTLDQPLLLLNRAFPKQVVIFFEELPQILRGHRYAIADMCDLLAWDGERIASHQARRAIFAIFSAGLSLLFLREPMYGHRAPPDPPVIVTCANAPCPQGHRSGTLRLHPTR